MQVDFQAGEMSKDLRDMGHQRRVPWNDVLAAKAQLGVDEAGTETEEGKASMRTREEERIAAVLKTFGGKN